MLRVEIGAGHGQFMLHITGHPEISRKVLQNVYQGIKRAHPKMSEPEVLKRLVLSRWESAFRDQGDLFGLSTAPNDMMRRAILSQIVSVYPHHHALIDAIILYEEESPLTLPPAPGMEAALRKVTAILRDH